MPCRRRCARPPPGDAGGGFLAAPVSGGWRDCRDGTLLFLCGGSSAAYEAACVSHGLDAMGHKRWLLGPTPGDAARAKLMLQVMMGNIVGVARRDDGVDRCLRFGRGGVLDVLSNSAMGNHLCTAKGALMREHFSPNFQVYLQQKDLRLALQLADDLGVPAPHPLAAANGQYIRARGRWARPTPISPPCARRTKLSPSRTRRARRRSSTDRSCPCHAVARADRPGETPSTARRVAHPRSHETMTD